MTQKTSKSVGDLASSFRIAERGRYYRENNFKSVSDWASQMEKEFGEDVILLLPEIWNSLSSENPQTVQSPSPKKEEVGFYKGKLIELFGGICLFLIIPAILRVLNIPVNPFTLIPAYAFLILVPFTYYYLRKDAAAASKSPQKTIAPKPPAKRSLIEIPTDQPLWGSVKLGIMAVVYFWLCIIGAILLAVLGLWLTGGGN